MMPTRYPVLGVCALLLLAVGLVFGQTLRFGFVNIDDDKYVYDNPQVAGGLGAAGIVWAFTHSHAANWHPLTWLSLMLDCQLHGLDGGGYHLTNVLLHAATTVLLFLVLRQMTGQFWPSALVASLFAIHPLRAESVAWVTERKDVLSGLLFTLTLGAYLGYVRRQFSLLRYLAVLFLFALGLMAKPMLVTLPLVLLLLDYWPLGRFESGSSLGSTPAQTPAQCNGGNFPGSADSAEATLGRPSFPRHLFIEKLPLLAMVAVSCMTTLWAQQELMVSEARLPLSARVANALVSYVAYMGQFFCPRGLALFYPHPGTHLPIWKVVGAAALLACVSVAVLARWRRCPYLLVGWLWYLGMLTPVIGLKQVAGQAMADRYTYLSQIGLGIALVWWAADLCRDWPNRRTAWSVASALALAVLMGCAWRQTSFWRDSETLWNRSLACTSYNKVAHNNLAAELLTQGRLDEAMGHYRQSLEINPDDADAVNSLGAILDRLGRFDEALACYRKSQELKPDDAIAYYNLGNLLANRGRFDEALDQFQRAIEINPHFSKAHGGLGVALAARGRPGEALKHYRIALKLQPDNLVAQKDLAWLRATCPETALRDGAEAIELAQRVNQRCGGQQPDVLDTLAAAYAETGLFSEALAAASKARELAMQQNDRALADALRARIALYQNGRPFHCTPPAAPMSAPKP